MYVTYAHPEFGDFAQYCRRNAGYYRQFPRRLRRELEIKAHAAGVSQPPAMWDPGLGPNGGWRKPR